MQLKNGRLAQLVRALSSHDRGQWSESTSAHHKIITKCEGLSVVRLPAEAPSEVEGRRRESSSAHFLFLVTSIWFLVRQLPDFFVIKIYINNKPLDLA